MRNSAVAAGAAGCGGRIPGSALPVYSGWTGSEKAPCSRGAAVAGDERTASQTGLGAHAGARCCCIELVSIILGFFHFAFRVILAGGAFPLCEGRLAGKGKPLFLPVRVLRCLCASKLRNPPPGETCVPASAYSGHLRYVAQRSGAMVAQLLVVHVDFCTIRGE